MATKTKEMVSFRSILNLSRWELAARWKSGIDCHSERSEESVSLKKRRKSRFLGQTRPRNDKSSGLQQPARAYFWNDTFWLQGGIPYSKDLKTEANLQRPEFWNLRKTRWRGVAFRKVLLDTIASSMTRVCTSRLTRGTP